MNYNKILNIVFLIVIGMYIGDFINYMSYKDRQEIYLPFYGTYSCTEKENNVVD